VILPGALPPPAAAGRPLLPAALVVPPLLLAAVQLVGAQGALLQVGLGALAVLEVWAAQAGPGSLTLRMADLNPSRGR